MQALSKGNHISSVLTSVATNDLIASTTELSPNDFNGMPHYHDNAHFSFVLRGGCAEKKKTGYERLPGSITWYDAGEIHQIIKVKQSSFHVNFELPPSFYSTYEINQETIATAISNHPDTKIMMLNVFKELAMPDENTINSLEIILLNIIQEAAKVNRNEIPQWVKIVKEVLNDRWNEKVTLTELSKACGVHPVTISKYFAYYFSCTLGEYLRKQKVNRAIEMIKQTNDLSSVAFACGFADQSHFIRTFKSITNLLPTAYRKL
ncbi:MAG: helix-turn-helix transcriptional regulator [Bacteroidota bacterium]